MQFLQVLVPVWRAVNLLAGIAQIGLHSLRGRYVVHVLSIVSHSVDQERIRVDATCVALMRQGDQGLDVGHVGAQGL